MRILYKEILRLADQKLEEIEKPSDLQMYVTWFESAFEVMESMRQQNLNDTAELCSGIIAEELNLLTKQDRADLIAAMGIERFGE